MQRDNLARISPAAPSLSVVELTQTLVRIPSVTAVDAKDLPASEAALAVLADIARASGATVTPLTFEGGHAKWPYAVPNLFIDWTFGNGQKHLCYMGHVDVVPPGDITQWSADPFSGLVADGYLYGRGTTDMKGSVAAFLSAIVNNIDTLHASANIRISMIVTADEEWAAVNGSRKVLGWMAEQGMTPDAFLVGEPSSQDILGSHIKIGRRGSLCGTLQIKGVQGHAAYQGLFENPNRALALAMTILNSHRFNDGNDHFPNTNFEAIALTSGNFNATAIVPGKADMLWNIRFTPDHTPDSLETFVKEKLAVLPDWAAAHPDAALLKNITVVANKDTASIPYRSQPGALAQAVKTAVAESLNIAAQFDGSGGTTDGRFVQLFFPAAEVIEFGVPERGGIVGDMKPADYLAKGGMHQVDERVSLTDLAHLETIYVRTVMFYADRP